MAQVIVSGSQHCWPAAPVVVQQLSIKVIVSGLIPTQHQCNAWISDLSDAVLIKVYLWSLLQNKSENNT